MKKMYLSAAVLTAMMVSCSSNEEEYKTGGLESDAVSFSTYVNMPKRALDKSAFAVGDQLCVNAFLSSGSMIGQEFTNNFMQNEVLTKDATGWNYTNTKFWPMNTTDRISFVASYPNISPAIEDGICSFAFTVNANPATQQDFLWSTITDAHRTDRNGTHQNGVVESPTSTPLDDVTLRFRHALSKVTFNAKAAANYHGATITVTGIEVKNLYDEGTYALTDELATGNWTVSGQQDNNYTVLTGGTTTVDNANYKPFGTSLLMLPQTLSITDGTASTVTIRYTVAYQNPDRTVNEERTFNLATASITAWEQNKVYNYNFNIALDMITFDAVNQNQRRRAAAEGRDTPDVNFGFVSPDFAGTLGRDETRHLADQRRADIGDRFGVDFVILDHPDGGGQRGFFLGTVTDHDFLDCIRVAVHRHVDLRAVSD